jgi:hypothetical protein
MHDELAGRPGVAEVSTLQAVWIGPRQLLLCADLVFAPGEDIVSWIAAMREELLEMSVIAAVKLTPVAA